MEEIMGVGAAGTLRTEVKDFLERLGRTVEEQDRQLIVRDRTALIEGEMKFRLLETESDRPLKSKNATNIVADGVPLPNLEQYPNTYRFDEFLDKTIHAEDLAKGVRENQRVQEQSEVFIPQHVRKGGDVQTATSREFFFKEWMPATNSQLLAVLAPAGYGKTVLTCALADRLAENYLGSKSSPRPPFPYLINFGEFRRLSSFEAMILTSLQDKGITDYHSNAFAYLVARRRVILILDGFDELLDERPEEAQKNLRELIETLEGRGQVVVTARSTFFRTSDDVANFLEYYTEPEQVTVVDLEPFDAGQRSELVAKFTPDKTAFNRVSRFVESESLREPMGSPLLLRETIDALLTDKDSRLDIARGRRDLFGELERSVYERERERKNHGFADQAQRDFLEGLGREMLEYNVRGFDWEEVQVAASEAAPDADPVADAAELDRFADHHFLHVEGESREVHFNHQVFREYFQARALLDACEAGQDDWIMSILAHRPLPEEVCSFVAELDDAKQFPGRLLEWLDVSERPSDRLVSNVGGVCAEYRDADLIKRLVARLPKDVVLSFRLFGIDLSGSDWSGRFLQGMGFTNCSLLGADFSGSVLSSVALNRTAVNGARFTDAAVESLTLGFDERVFGTADALERLATLGADCGFENEERQQTLREKRHEELVELVHGRLKRFFVAGREGSEDSRWDSSIQERNLLGGVKPSDRGFIKSRLIPAMVSCGVFARRRAHGVVIYDLTDAAEDDARALMEGDDLVGMIEAVVERLEARDPSSKESALGPG